MGNWGGVLPKKPINWHYHPPLVSMEERIKVGPITFQLMKVDGKFDQLIGRQFFRTKDVSVKYQAYIYTHLAEMIGAWDISRLVQSMGRVWVKHQDTVLPALLTWVELGQLARALQLEMADATRLIIEVKPDGLFATGIKKDPKEATNREIRAQISDYLAGASQQTPALLAADIRDDGTIYLCDLNGQPYYLPVRTAGEINRFSFAQIVFLSRQTYTVRIYNRYIGHCIPRPSVERATPAELLGEGGTLPVDALTLPDNGRLTPRQQSKAIQDWLFMNGELIVSEVDRKIGKSGVIKLVNKDGLPYELSGLRDIFNRGINDVVIRLGETVIKGQRTKIVNIFDPGNNRNSLASFALYPERNRGAKLDYVLLPK